MSLCLVLILLIFRCLAAVERGQHDGCDGRVWRRAGICERGNHLFCCFLWSFSLRVASRAVFCLCLLQPEFILGEERDDSLSTEHSRCEHAVAEKTFREERGFPLLSTPPSVSSEFCGHTLQSKSNWRAVRIRERVRDSPKCARTRIQPCHSTLNPRAVRSRN